MARTLTITKTGQVTLSRELMAHLGVGPGDRITVDFQAGGRAELRSAKSAGSIQQFIGSLQRPGTKALSIKDIAEAAATGWAGKR